MIKHVYTIEDARREMREMKEEEYNYNQIRVFLNYLYGGKYIKREEWQMLGRELLEMFSD